MQTVQELKRQMDRSVAADHARDQLARLKGEWAERYGSRRDVRLVARALVSESIKVHTDVETLEKPAVQVKIADFLLEKPDFWLASVAVAKEMPGNNRRRGRCVWLL